MLSSPLILLIIAMLSIAMLPLLLCFAMILLPLFHC